MKKLILAILLLTTTSAFATPGWKQIDDVEVIDIDTVTGADQNVVFFKLSAPTITTVVTVGVSCATGKAAAKINKRIVEVPLMSDLTGRKVIGFVCSQKDV